MDKDQARQLNAKIQLDSKIRKKAERLLRQMARDFGKLYAEKGVYLDFNAYAEKWQRLLARHYKNVQDEFIGVASEELDVPMSRDKMALFILALQIMREQRASASSRQIIDTSTEQMADSISKAELYMQQESMPISNDAVAALEDEMVTWTPESGWSPNRIDAMVWGFTFLWFGSKIADEQIYFC
jgi:hypothetical protein